MQSVNTHSSPTGDFCQLDIFANEDLTFSVRVSCGSRRFISGGYMNPDEAQRRGMRALLAMNGLHVEDHVTCETDCENELAADGGTGEMEGGILCEEDCQAFAELASAS